MRVCVIYVNFFRLTNNEFLSYKAQNEMKIIANANGTL